jgi:3-oxoacyl-[acyl-carrier-protein] synthase-3
VESARAALADSGVAASDIDLVIVATSSPDDLFGDAASVASAIGSHKAAAFDVTAACSGFLFGVVTASQFMHTGAYKKVLVIGADALTRFLDWTDRGTCILFGDGAGAIVMEATDSSEESGVVLCTYVYSAYCMYMSGYRPRIEILRLHCYFRVQVC